MRRHMRADPPTHRPAPPSSLRPRGSCPHQLVLARRPRGQAAPAPCTRCRGVSPHARSEALHGCAPPPRPRSWPALRPRSRAILAREPSPRLPIAGAIERASRPMLRSARRFGTPRLGRRPGRPRGDYRLVACAPRRPRGEGRSRCHARPSTSATGRGRRVPRDLLDPLRGQPRTPHAHRPSRPRKNAASRSPCSSSRVSLTSRGYARCSHERPGSDRALRRGLRLLQVEPGQDPCLGPLPQAAPRADPKRRGPAALGRRPRGEAPRLVAPGRRRAARCGPPGAAAPPLLDLMPGGRPLAAAGRAFPGATELAYRAVAGNRDRLARLLRIDASCSVRR